MALLELRQEITANNLANAATAGFRRDVVAARQAQPGEAPLARGALALGVLDTRAVLDSGPLEQTGNATDLAISGAGFFVVQSGSDELLTRAGAFHRGPTGELVTESGARLLGDGGPIRLDADAFQVGRDGGVLVAGSLVDTIRVVSAPPGAALRKQGDGRFAMPAAGAGPRPPDAEILQGYLEGSNVDAIREMIALVDAFRAYEANAKSVQTSDQILGQAVNQVGRVG
jgi:flagellar basal-body rod protein FlgG